MQNVPNIVRERLQAAVSPVNHPDADVLTAFAERSLSDRERAGVLEHLARCTDCRDVVVLALPAREELATVVRPSLIRWFTLPALRWGFVAAGIVAIASLGILHQRHLRPKETVYALKQPASLEVAANEPKQTIAPFAAAPADNKQKLQTPAAPAFTDSLNRDVALDEKNGNENKKLARAESPARTSATQGGAAPSKSAGALPHGPRLANQWQQSNVAQNQSPLLMPPSTVTKQDSGSVNGMVSGDSQTAMQVATVPSQTQDLTLEARAMPTPSAVQPSPTSNYALARVDKAKPAVNSLAANAPSAAASESGAVVGGMPRLSVPGPRWEVTAAGALQRSFDQGASWQTVDVNADSASATSAASLEISAEEPRAKRVKKEKDAKKTARDGDSSALTFRTVAATGSDVWAGGSAGMLYHSVDSGNHWVRVIPISSGSFLTGDILRLEFSDPQHGKVSTSTPETWITANAGQTWQKQ
jgi:hypothetical protein